MVHRSSIIHYNLHSDVTYDTLYCSLNSMYMSNDAFTLYNYKFLALFPHPMCEIRKETTLDRLVCEEKCTTDFNQIVLSYFLIISYPNTVFNKLLGKLYHGLHGHENEEIRRRLFILMPK